MDYFWRIALHAIRGRPRDNLSAPSLRGCLAGFLPTSQKGCLLCQDYRTIERRRSKPDVRTRLSGWESRISKTVAFVSPPPFLALAFLVISSADGILWKFSFLNKIFSTRYAFIALYMSHWAPLIVLILLWAWLRERWVMRDAEACSATSFSVTGRRASYSFRGERGEYYGGDCVYVGLVQPLQLATVVFYNGRKPELNKIAMGLLFHRLTILGRGVTDLDKQTLAAQTALAETTSGTGN